MGFEVANHSKANTLERPNDDGLLGTTAQSLLALKYFTQDAVNTTHKHTLAESLRSCRRVFFPSDSCLQHTAAHRIKGQLHSRNRDVVD